MKKIGFIGVGVMGKAMVRNLIKHGFDVTIYTRTKAKVEDLIAEGIPFVADVKSCAQDQDVVITMVGYPSDVKEVYFGKEGIIENAKAGAILIDMTTSSPDLAKDIAKEAKAHQLESLDAPVSGGDTGARNGTLAIMVGGSKDAYEKVLPVFQAMGQNIVYEGQAGAGQHTKMANQIALAGAVAGVVEAMTYAKQAGLDVKTMLDTISTGAAGSWQMSNTAPRMLSGDMNPGFYIKHMIKDLKIAIDQADQNGLDLEVLDTVKDMYEDLADRGMEDLGTQALIHYYDDKAR